MIQHVAITRAFRAGQNCTSLGAVPDIGRRTARNSPADVGTLLDSHCAKGDGGLDGRVQFFALCFDRAELDVVAVQESREQGDSHRPDLLHDRFCASSDTMGRFGTQIWIRRSSGVVLDNFEAVSPQLAAARVRFHGVARSVISAHAPHEFRTSKVKSTFGESVRAQPLHSPRLLTNPSRRLQCPIGLSFAPPHVQTYPRRL